MSTTALAQDSSGEAAEQEAELEVAEAEQADDTASDTREAQAQLSNPFGHTRPMFQADRLRSRR